MAVALLETNAVSDLMRDQAQIKARATAFAGQIITCSIVRGEIRFGIDRMAAGKKKNDLEKRALVVFTSIRCEPITPQIADIYGPIRASLEAKGLPLDDNDLWIAASALSLGAILVTRDQVFGQVPGLMVEDWTT